MPVNNKTKAVVQNPHTHRVFICQCKDFTAKVGIDLKEIIMESSDNISQFIGQPLTRLEAKMQSIGDFKRIEI